MSRARFFIPTAAPAAISVPLEYHARQQDRDEKFEQKRAFLRPGVGFGCLRLEGRFPERPSRRLGSRRQCDTQSQS
jgi:hypothetical protein